MSIPVLCPSCGVKLAAPDAAAGRALKCPKGGEKVAIPGGGNAQVGRLAPPVPSQSGLPLATTAHISLHLMADERLIAVTHPMVLVDPGIFAAFGLLLCFGIVAGQSGYIFAVIGIPTAAIAGGKMLALWVERMTTEFSCTDRRILIKSGLLTTTLREMPLAKVEALLMQQGLFGKIFGYGTLIFKGSGGTRRTCKSIEAPFDFYKRVQEQVAAAQQHG